MKVRANVTQLWLCKGDECSFLMPLNLLRIQYLGNSEYSVYMALLSQYALLVLKPSSRRTFMETVLLCFFPMIYSLHCMYFVGSVNSVYSVYSAYFLFWCQGF